MINWPKEKNVGDVYVSPNGAKWRWNGKAWASVREKDTNVGGGITYQFSHCPIDPVDNVSYYIGDISDLPPQSNSSTSSKRVKALAGGRISQVTIKTQILSQLGTAELQTFTLRNHTKGTSVVITSGYSHSSNSQLDNFQLETQLEVSANDELCIIWSVPTFAVSPRGVRHNFNIYVEK